MQNGECPWGLAVLSPYDIDPETGSTLFVIVIGQASLAAFDFLIDFKGHQSSQATENTKYHQTEHTFKRLSASPPCKEPVFRLAEDAVFTRWPAASSRVYFYIGRDRLEQRGRVVYNRLRRTLEKCAGIAPPRSGLAPIITSVMNLS